MVLVSNVHLIQFLTNLVKYVDLFAQLMKSTTFHSESVSAKMDIIQLEEYADNAQKILSMIKF